MFAEWINGSQDEKLLHNFITSHFIIFFFFSRFTLETFYSFIFKLTDSALSILPMSCQRHSSFLLHYFWFLVLPLILSQSIHLSNYTTYCFLHSIFFIRARNILILIILHFTEIQICFLLRSDFHLLCIFKFFSCIFSMLCNFFFLL